MTFVIVTHVPHTLENKQYYAYAPYVREMNVWLRYVEELILVAPEVTNPVSAIDSVYEHKKIQFVPIASFDVLSLPSIMRSIFKIPRICWRIFLAMRAADHIHLRCPGNIGLLGCLIQILFPNTPKTAKYAGNWDPNSKQPWTYKLQQWILNTPFLTRNMQVLVYGEWEATSKNILPFFTATYAESEKVPLLALGTNTRIDFVFVGALVPGKNPLYAIQLVAHLFVKGLDVRLHLYGEGPERAILEAYIHEHQLETTVFLMGNKNSETVKAAYQKSHFVILPSESEGWPKAIAEGMFWGCIPIATMVSCVPFMLDYGERGILIEMDVERDCEQIAAVLRNEFDFDTKRIAASNWSREYTLEVFEEGIREVLGVNGEEW
jgi:glycosyltransferase involved in cell wall biosynthesis